MSHCCRPAIEFSERVPGENKFAQLIPANPRRSPSAFHVVEQRNGVGDADAEAIGRLGSREERPWQLVELPLGVIERL